MLIDAVGVDITCCGNANLQCSMIPPTIHPPTFHPPTLPHPPTQLQSTAWSSWVGMTGIAVWCTITMLLTLAALIQGHAFPLPVLPDVGQLGRSWWEVGNELAAIIPIIGTAYTCQMTMHFVMTGVCACVMWWCCVYRTRNEWSMVVCLHYMYAMATA